MRSPPHILGIVGSITRVWIALLMVCAAAYSQSAQLGSDTPTRENPWQFPYYGGSQHGGDIEVGVRNPQIPYHILSGFPTNPKPYQASPAAIVNILHGAIGGRIWASYLNLPGIWSVSFVDVDLLGSPYFYIYLDPAGADGTLFPDGLRSTTNSFDAVFHVPSQTIVPAIGTFFILALRSA